MKRLRIFVDFSGTPESMQLLREGTSGHELVFPSVQATSVLAQGAPDPLMETADVAFGQPNPEGVQTARNLKWIQVSSSSITRYDTPAFRSLASGRKIVVCNSAHVYNETCAVHVLSFMLAQARHLVDGLKTRTESGSREWTSLRSESGNLRGEKTIILGYGAIGERLVELLKPFDMDIVAYRRAARGNEIVPIITASELNSKLAECDHVINILPDSSETRLFFNSSRFDAIKKGAVFYNIGRGTTVDQDALLAALRSNRLKAAWLDVTEPEPLPLSHPLLTTPNCHITPHTAGGHANESSTLVRHFLKNFRLFIDGKPLFDRVM